MFNNSSINSQNFPFRNGAIPPSKILIKKASLNNNTGQQNSKNFKYLEYFSIIFVYWPNYILETLAKIFHYVTLLIH